MAAGRRLSMKYGGGMGYWCGMDDVRPRDIIVRRAYVRSKGYTIACKRNKRIRRTKFLKYVPLLNIVSHTEKDFCENYGVL